MTTLLEAERALAQRFADAWTPTGFPFALENEDPDVLTSQPWARFVIRVDASTQDTLGSVGNRKFERSGRCLIQIFVPTDTGVTQSVTLRQTVLEAFEGSRIVGTTIYFTDVIPRSIGIDGNWHQSEIEVNFTFFEIR